MSVKTLVLNYGRCSWGKCVFCGYGRIFGNTEGLDDKIRGFFKTVDAGDMVKVFGSGSFLDEKQIPRRGRKLFTKECRDKKIKALTVESRPEYVSHEILGDFRGISLTVCIGLETASDSLRKRLDKGFLKTDFEKAAKIIHESGAKVRTYILVNPPYVKNPEKELDDSVEYALEHSDSLVLINLLPHGNTPLMRLWLNGEWDYLSRADFHRISGKWSENPKVELDEETFRFTPQFPVELREPLDGVGEQYLTHRFFEVWQDYLCRWYTPPGYKRILLFLPCSHRKPYSESKTHQGIVSILETAGARGIIHEVMLSNAGVVPREFENKYPFETYDWDESLETEEVKLRYVQVTQERITGYLTVHGKRYEKVYCFLRYDSDSYQALEKACTSMGVEFENLLKKNTFDMLKGTGRPIQSEKALKDLACIKDKL